MSDDPDGPRRGRKPRVTDGELIEAIRDALDETDAPVVSTAVIVERVPIGKRAVQKRLGRLGDDALSPVETTNIGARARVWWLEESDAEESEEDEPVK